MMKAESDRFGQSRASNCEIHGVPWLQKRHFDFLVEPIHENSVGSLLMQQTFSMLPKEL